MEYNEALRRCKKRVSEKAGCYKSMMLLEEERLRVEERGHGRGG